MEQVVLVDENDNELGLMDKLEAHRGDGKLHRAVSVLLYRENNGIKELLLQQRSGNKPLWPMFWSNTVCTHPRKNESLIDCATRRLEEEMGIEVDNNELTFIFKLLYQAKYNEKYSEHELDHVFVGRWEGEPNINKQEVNDWKWMKLKDLLDALNKTPEEFTPWLKILMNNKVFLQNLK